MERLRSLNQGLKLGLGIVLAGMLNGCAGTRSDLKALIDGKPNLHTVASSSPAAGSSASTLPSVVKEIVQAKHTDRHAPATEFACGWQTRLAQLPDPTKSGAMTPGLVGQIFLFTADVKPAEVNGDLTVMVNDASIRPPGMPMARPEVWHFSADTLRKMVVDDERFGRSVVVFLPWPPEWHDVNRLSIQARFDQQGSHTLYAQPTTVTLDFSGNGPGQPPVIPGMPTSLTAIPDPRVVLQQQKTQPPMVPSTMMASRSVSQPPAMAFPNMMNGSSMPASPPAYAQAPASFTPPVTSPQSTRPPMPNMVDSSMGPMKVQQVGYNGFGIPQLQPAAGSPPATGVQQAGYTAPSGGLPPPQMPAGNSDGSRFVIPRPQ